MKGLNRKINSRIVISLLISSQLTLVTTALNAAEPNWYAKGMQAEYAGDYQSATEHYTKSANKGVSDASLAIGRSYKALGEYSSSLEWYLKAAKAGNEFAQYELGLVYLHGSLAAAIDLGEAFKWLSFAARSGHGDACYELFKLAKDVAWLRKAAEQGIPSAIKDLADAYEQGLYGLEVDMAESRLWSQRFTESQE